ncbi:MAG TPA: phage tail assembly protein [Thiotrichales bacterium]|nr:phage tail assembly protein [Thiotrichales bacterium]
MQNIITLTYPIEHDGLPIKDIALRRPTVGDHLSVQKMTASDAEKEIRLIANLSELPPEVIYQLDMKDYAAIQKVLGDFLS